VGSDGVTTLAFAHHVLPSCSRSPFSRLWTGRGGGTVRAQAGPTPPDHPKLRTARAAPGGATPASAQGLGRTLIGLVRHLVGLISGSPVMHRPGSTRWCGRGLSETAGNV